MLISTLSYAPGQPTIVVPGCDEKGLSSFLFVLYGVVVGDIHICLIICIVYDKWKFINTGGVLLILI